MNSKLKTDLIKEIQKAKIYILFNIISKVDIKKENACYTNGSKIIIGENFFKTPKQLMILILHEYLHIAGNSIVTYKKYYKPNHVSMEAHNIIEDFYINRFIEAHFPGVLAEIDENISEFGGGNLVNQENFVSIFNSLNPCIFPEVYDDYRTKFKNNKVIRKIQEMGYNKFNLILLSMENHFTTDKIKHLLNTIGDTNDLYINYKFNYPIKYFDFEEQILELKYTNLIFINNPQIINRNILYHICSTVFNFNISWGRSNVLYDILFEDELKINSNMNSDFKNRQKFLNNNNIKIIDIENNPQSLFDTPHKKLKSTSKIEKVILKATNKFLIKKGSTRTWRREHKTLNNRKGKIHKSRGIKNIRVFIDKSGSMNGNRWKNTLSTLEGLNKICNKYQMNAKYTFFDTELTGIYNFKEIINSNFTPSGGTNINRVLNQIKNSEYNIIITDMEASIDLSNIKSNLLFIHLNSIDYNITNFDKNIHYVRINQ